MVKAKGTKGKSRYRQVGEETVAGEKEKNRVQGKKTVKKRVKRKINTKKRGMGGGGGDKGVR